MDRKPDFKFLCKKCELHLMFIDKRDIKRIEKLPRTSCPACGEEGIENWIFIGSGNYEQEYPENN